MYTNITRSAKPLLSICKEIDLSKKNKHCGNHIKTFVTNIK